MHVSTTVTGALSDNEVYTDAHDAPPLAGCTRIFILSIVPSPQFPLLHLAPGIFSRNVPVGSSSQLIGEHAGVAGHVVESLVCSDAGIVQIPLPIAGVNIRVCWLDGVPQSVGQDGVQADKEHSLESKEIVKKYVSLDGVSVNCILPLPSKFINLRWRASSVSNT
jgi:hypothetical protein